MTLREQAEELYKELICSSVDDCPIHTPHCVSEQIGKIIAAFEKVRSDALEEAAKCCDGGRIDDIPEGIRCGFVAAAAAIRSLKTKVAEDK